MLTKYFMDSESVMMNSIWDGCGGFAILALSKMIRHTYLLT